jgi:hypothetical protein
MYLHIYPVYTIGCSRGKTELGLDSFCFWILACRVGEGRENLTQAHCFYWMTIFFPPKKSYIMKISILNPKNQFKNKIGFFFLKIFTQKKRWTRKFSFSKKKVLFGKKKTNWGGVGEPYPGPLFVHPKKDCTKDPVNILCILARIKQISWSLQIQEPTKTVHDSYQTIM